MRRQVSRKCAAICAANKRERRRIWSTEKARVRRGATPNPKFVKRGKLIALRLVAPSSLNFAIAEMRVQTLEFLRRIRKHSSQKNLQLILDFSQVERIFPTGAAMLVAEVHRALARKCALLQAKRSRTPVIDEVLQQIGIYDKLGVACTNEPTSESVIHWRVASGVLAEGSAGGSILENYEGRLAEGLTKGLYDGVVEAMTNTVHHAYADDVPGGTDLRHFIGRRWWILSQEREGILTVVICDLGVGIPRSLPRSKTFESATVREFWRNTGLDRSDGSAISVALQLGRTRTAHKQRGKGLADIVDAVNLSKDGGVIIFSNRGILTSNHGDEKVHTHSHSINGTMVHWNVTISDNSSDNG